MNILLINPPCRLPYLLPLGLGYIASVLREEGHNVKILDINGLGYSNEKVEEAIKAIEFDVVGIGGLTSTYKYVKWLANMIKELKPYIPIIAGNMVSTAHPELLLRNSKVDIAVIDEGELTIKELVSAISKGLDLGAVKGIYYKNNARGIIKAPPRERITNLDSLPFPAWDLFPMEVYLHNSTQSAVMGLRMMNISSERGCPYECTFCSHPFGRKIYMRSAKSIVNEIKELKKRYRVKLISFIDDLFIVDEKRVLEFCDRIISDNLNIRWAATGRANLVNNNLLRRMRKAGCVELGYGFESGSQTVLDKLKKRVTVKQAEEAVRMTQKAGIKVAGTFIFGMPGETRDTIKETLEFIKRTRVPTYRFFYATPYPKTELYEIAKKMGRLPEDEDKYVESLGEMRTTFLVNLTDFSDEELVRLKNLAEVTAKRSLGVKFQLEDFLEDWHRRFIIARMSIKNSGIIPTMVKVCSKIRHKLVKGSQVGLRNN